MGPAGLPRHGFSSSVPCANGSTTPSSRPSVVQRGYPNNSCRKMQARPVQPKYMLAVISDPIGPARPAGRCGPRCGSSRADRIPVCGQPAPGNNSQRTALQGVHSLFRAWLRRGWPAPASSDPEPSTGSRHQTMIARRSRRSSEHPVASRWRGRSRRGVEAFQDRGSLPL